MYCCNVLRNLVLNAGDRGFAVLLQYWAGEFRFALQMRAVTYEDEAKLKAEPSPCQLPVTNATLSASLFIKHCPACGFPLADLLARSKPEFENLAAQHVAFLNKLPDLRKPGSESTSPD